MLKRVAIMVVVLLVGVSTGRRASADGGATLLLQANAGELPVRVCVAARWVVHAAKAARTPRCDERVRDSNCYTTEDRVIAPLPAGRSPEVDGTHACGDARCSFAGPGAGKEAFDIDAHLGSSKGSDTAAAFLCTGAPAASGEGRVLVLALHAGDKGAATEAQLTDVSLRGGVLGLRWKSSTMVRATLEVLGGDYLARDSAPIAQGAVGTVALAPRCRMTPFEILAAPGDSKISVGRVHPADASAPACEMGGSDRRVIALPLGVGRKGVFVTMTQGGRTVGEFASEWTEDVPPEVLRLQPKVLEFLWERHCLVPPGECPEASLASTSKACSPVEPVEGAPCRYRCEAPAGGFLESPTRVLMRRFRGGAAANLRQEVARWELSVPVADARVTSFVSPEEYFVDLGWHDWTRGNRTVAQVKARNRAKIEAVVLRDADGRNHFVVPAEGARLRLPGVACTESFGVSFVGERSHESRHVDVKSGKIEIPAPFDLEDRVRVGLRPALGFNVPLAAPRKAGGVSYEGRLVAPVAVVAASLGIRPRDSSYTIEPGLFGVLTTSSYYPAQQAGPARDANAVPLANVGLDLVVLRSLSFPMDFGPRVAAVIAVPASSADFERAGAARVELGLGLVARYVLSETLALDIRPTLLMPRTVYVHDSSTTSVSETLVRSYDSFPLQFEFGARVGL